MRSLALISTFVFVLLVGASFAQHEDPHPGPAPHPGPVHHRHHAPPPPPVHHHHHHHHPMVHHP